MTVRQLIERLGAYPPDAPVLIVDRSTCCECGSHDDDRAPDPKPGPMQPRQGEPGVWVDARYVRADVPTIEGVLL